MEVALKPDVLRWARGRAGLTRTALAQKIGTKAERVREWEQTGKLRFKQAEKLAKATFTPFGQLYLSDPPDDRLPIPDFRTVGAAEVRRPSPDLIDVLDDALQRRDWYRDYLLAEGELPLAFVGSLNAQTPIVEAAGLVRAVVGFELATRELARTWEDALTQQISHIESSGVLVMRTGIVRSNTHRPLSVDEFRGFALADAMAPVIFVNGRDAPAAQMFTLAHELVHIFLGASGVSNLARTYSVARTEERFCNEVAAELLVPEANLRAIWPDAKTQENRVAWLVRRFRVSSLVILRRLTDLELIDRNAFDRLYRDEVATFRALAAARESGGDFYRTQRTRSGLRFARALIASTLEGRTPYRDALRLLGISRTATFNEFARQLGFLA